MKEKQKYDVFAAMIGKYLTKEPFRKVFKGRPVASPSNASGKDRPHEPRWYRKARMSSRPIPLNSKLAKRMIEFERRCG